MILILSALLFAGMQTAEPLRIEATWIGEQCGLRFAGEPLELSELESQAKGWARDKREVQIRGSTEVPYRCIGGIIFAIQAAGVTKVGFVTGPEMVTVELPAGRCRILADGKLVTFKELRILARSWHHSQPRINFRPTADTSYSCTDRALRILYDENAGSLGFTGNDQDAPEPEVAPR